MKKFWKILTQVGLSVVLLLQVAGATEIDRLVRELVKKGVIDPAKAQEILTLTEQDVKKSLAKGEVETVPKWTQIIDLKGDFRYRSQWEEKEGSDPRFRQRLRFRLGGEAQVSPGWQVGFGIATGGTDPRSTNQTFENMFESKGLMLDYAYGKYIAPKYLTAMAGKFVNKSAFWKPSDLLWDGDISVEGVTVNLSQKSVYLNTGYFVLDEIKAESDPVLMVLQPGAQFVIDEKYEFQFGATGYQFDGLKGRLPAHSSETNSYSVDPATGNLTGLINDYKAIGFSGAAGINNLIFPYVGLFTEIISNTEVNANGNGYLFGLTLGAKKVAYRKDWQFIYNYRHLEKDAWPDFLPDSDTYGGATGIQGHELILLYGLSKNVNVAFDYYQIEKILGSATPQQLMQIDFNFKF